MRAGVVLAVGMAGVFAQTPAMEINVVYVCNDGQSFKVFSCEITNGVCDYQNYKNGRAFQRGEALRVQLAALLPAKCHAQTAAEAKADPHTGELPAGAPLRPRTASNSPTGANSQPGAGGFKVVDNVRVLTSGWQDAKVLQVRGNSYYVRLENGIEVSKSWPIEVRRAGKLTAEDHALGQWDLHEKVQASVNGRWLEGEVVGQSYNRYTVGAGGTASFDGGSGSSASGGAGAQARPDCLFLQI